MGEISYDKDALYSEIEKLNKEYCNICELFDCYQSKVVGNFAPDNPDRFIRAMKLSDTIIEFNKIKDQIVELRFKIQRNLEVYENVEKLNQQLVDELPDGMGIEFETSGTDNSGISTDYCVVSRNQYVLNSNYDFDDWLVKWALSRY